ncbi:hypothetical protein [Methyloversatilis sp.]|uniref:hypothetical protein n=1 Tax=Methyloversatilis sp. TaxID=2569862 RepID=UPI0035B3F230
MSEQKARMTAWAVFLNGKQIDTVFYLPEITAQEVREGLINHDGYDPQIVVRKEKQ